MKKRILIGLALLLAAFSLSANPLHFGLEGTFGTSIGTGKGNWDWTESELGIQRTTPVNSGIALLLLADLGRFFQLESGAGYYWNKCTVQNGSDLWTYTQETLEIPLGLRLFFGDDRGFYIKGGTALILLTGSPSYINDGSQEDMFVSGPENTAHAGLQFGLGYQKQMKRGLWEIGAKYITFYSPTYYERSDGSLGDTRFHRMAMNLAFLY
ncbi:MAG: hypothetical protein PQJ58_13075 [Spirochaetales bacterium]|nr:hypothetical protein [Spirochaetales bacterium]